jgi:gluconate transporter
MSMLTVLLCLLLLIVLITWAKISPFLAFLLTSLVAALALGMPLEKIPASLEKGLGSTLGSLVALLCLGAMFGRLVAKSGAAEKMAMTLMAWFGERYLSWALLLTGFVVGIPLFYTVGFVLLVPLVFSVAHRYNLSAVVLGIPMLAALSVTHGFLPPHPSPTALIPQLGASMSTTLWYGFIVAIPTILIAGPLFAQTLKHIEARPLTTFQVTFLEKTALPSAINSFLTALLPIFLLIVLNLMTFYVGENAVLKFLSEPTIVLLFTLIVATYTLGIAQGKTMTAVMDEYHEAIKDIALILLIVAGAGTLKQVLIDSGVSMQIALIIESLDINPLLLVWLIALVLRICIGSATVAGLTTAGIVAPIALSGVANPNLMVLAIGAGSLMCSHVNDAGFWLYKEYFNLSLKDTFRSWTLMETIVGVVGIVMVLLLDWLI